jgi:hypothetical protein
MARDHDPTQQVILQRTNGEVVWVGEWSAEQRALYLPTNALDFPDPGTQPPDPPPERVRLAFVGSQAVLINSAGVVSALVSGVPDKANLLAGDGVEWLELVGGGAPDGFVLTRRDSAPTGWAIEPSKSQAPLPDQWLLGDPLVYTQESVPVDDDIQYTRVQLPTSKTIGSMLYGLTFNSGPVLGARLAIYDQSDPTDPTQPPNAKVAETSLVTTGSTGVFSLALTSPYVITTAGYYWIALVLNFSTGTKRAISTGTSRAGVAPIQYATGPGGGALPATAGGLSTADAPVLYAAAEV